MSSPRRRSAMLRKAVVAAGVALLFSFLPIPAFDFVSVAGASSVGLPAMEDVSPQLLEEQQAAADEPLGEDRVAGTVEEAAPFTMIGVTFDTAPEEPVMVRVRDDAGEWAEWTELAFEADEGPDASTPEGDGAYGTEPIWVDAARGYEVSVGTQDAPDANVVLVREEQQRVLTDATPLADAAPPLDVRLRAEWGARPSSTSVAGSVQLAVVHHSASSNSYGPGDVPGLLRSTQAYHMDGRGWSDIAYNFVVDKYGGLWEGRGGGIDRPVIGAHAMGFNTGSVGVMVLGDYTSATPTAAALESVSRVIGWKLALHNVDPSGSANFTSGGSTSIPAGQVVHLPRVVGHQNVGATSCPGSIQNSLGSIRGRAQEWTTWTRAQLAPFGNLESVTGGNGTVSVSGWAIDPGRSAPAVVVASTTAQAVQLSANQSRPDVGAVHPGYPSAGFSGTISGVRPGLQAVCVRAASSFSSAHDAVMGCPTVYVTDPTGKSPVGGLDLVAPGPGTITVRGWALDPESSAAVTVDVQVDGATVATVSADRASTSVPSQYSGSVGTTHGYSTELRGVVGGSHTVCMRIRNLGQGWDVLQQCHQTVVPGAHPIGNFEAAGVSGRTIVMTGWALDPETVLQTNVMLVVEGRWYVVLANGWRPDIADAYPGYGAQHGFAGYVEASPGNHTVCAYSLNHGVGSHQAIGCHNVTVPK
ncbi:MAG: N-acetylmuramoyl-L-alanine amidase [Microthrixaceae bacterium]